MAGSRFAADSRILVIEDDAVVSETLTLYLGQAGYSVESVTDGAEGLARAQASGIALVVLDWMLPTLSGPEICRRLRRVSGVPILMLTARTAEADRLRGFETGADDYVSKPFSPREIVARVQALLRRTGASAQAAAPPPLRIGRLEIDAFRRSVRLGDRPVPVTATELRLLEALARHPGRTFTRDELVSRALGPDYEGLDRTIDTHVTNLRRKLEAGGAPRVIVTVHGIGYQIPAHDAPEDHLPRTDGD